MAERRMFAKTIIDSDAFLEMPQSTQLLYFHLSMRADDDGFINKPKAIMLMIGCKDDDLKLLGLKKFVIPFENGIVVIKHWKIHNYIAKDRYIETKYKDQKALLSLDENNAYKLTENDMYTECIQPVYEMDTQVRLGKVSIGKGSIDILGDEHPTECPIPYSNIINYLNAKTGSSYKSTSNKTQTLIKTRFNEHFTEQDFYTVIDNKVATWLNDPKMNKYLRPETLFGNKFEGYLNEKLSSEQPQQNNNKQNKSQRNNFEQRQYNDDYFDNFFNNTPSK